VVELASEGVLTLPPAVAWPHREAFVEQLDRAVMRASGLGRTLALLCVEFDREALFGGGGRAAARSAADLAEGLRACVREQHVLAHLGAARFAVLLSHSAEGSAETLAQRLQALAAEPGSGLLATFGLGLHIGIAAYPASGGSADELLAAAEQALQQSIAQGEPGWKLHSRSAQAPFESRRQQRLEKVIQAGLPGLAFRLHFQPRFDALHGGVQAMEALLRWHDDDDGLLLPGQFLPLAARIDAMETLDSWALEHGLRQAVEWRAEGWQQRLTVNVSGASISQPAYARRVAALLEATTWPAEALELDLTEIAVARDPEAALYNMQALRRMGVHLVLDDWGQGDSALSLLRRFPWSAVKIDRSLVRAVPGAKAESGVLRALVQMALALGLEAHAEGVEYGPQLVFLIESGCAGWQGLFGAGALEPKACERVFRARQGRVNRVEGRTGTM
jgi:EAL domain-containing protein (putative c-di-GMP-specific phosphodiesterase class I)